MKNSQPVLVAICTVYLALSSYKARADAYRLAIPAIQVPGKAAFHQRGAMSKADTALSHAFGEYLTHAARGKWFHARSIGPSASTS